MTEKPLPQPEELPGESRHPVTPDVRLHPDVIFAQELLQILDGAPDGTMLIEGFVERRAGRRSPATFDLGHADHLAGGSGKTRTQGVPRRQASAVPASRALAFGRFAHPQTRGRRKICDRRPSDAVA